MNCKQGDLAVIVKCVGGKSQERNIGHICRCVKAVRAPWGDPGWLIDPPAPLGQTLCTDGSLRPIRDPGDDARDEMLRPLPNEVTA